MALQLVNELVVSGGWTDGGASFGEKLPIGKTVFKLSDLRVNRKPEKPSTNNDIIVLIVSQKPREPSNDQ